MLEKTAQVPPTAALFTLAAFLTTAGCAFSSNGPKESFDDRGDLEVLYLDAAIDNGISDELSFEVPPGTDSILIEVRGSTGRYYLTKFVTPTGRDLIEASQFVTRGARELPGLVTWLYPNAPSVVPESGEYRIIIRAEDGEGGHVESEYLDVRVYLERDGASTGCGLHFDVLVADDAIVASDVGPMVDQMIADLVERYALAGVLINDYTSSSITLPTADLDLGGNPARVIAEVEDVMAAARAGGQVRSQAVHIIVVRSLGADLRGYSMGLPGPLGSDLATSAVLVSSSAFIDRDGFLDVAGMTETTAHEVGHYLGLYHTSEFDRTFHDPITDTPQCTETDCPAEFWNNLMTPGSTNRTDITPGQGAVMRNHPLCVPNGMDPLEPPPSVCDLTCDAPFTCAIRGGEAACARACDPNGDPCPNNEACSADIQGKFVCSGA